MWYFYDAGWTETRNPFTVARPAAFASDGLNGIEHLDHCINILRQSLQCFSDVSPYVFQWDEESHEVGAYADVAHTCRNFDAVRFPSPKPNFSPASSSVFALENETMKS